MNGEKSTTARAKQTHGLLVDETTCAFDVPGLRLALMSRGRHWLGRCPERDQLASLLGGGALAERLTSGAPIRVGSAAGAYLFEQRSFEGMRAGELCRAFCPQPGYPASPGTLPAKVALILSSS